MHDIESGANEFVDELMDETGELGDQEVDEFADAGEDELATGLLEATSDEEIDYFLGKALKGFGRFVRSKQGGMLKGMLRGLAKRALPVVGGAFGGPIGAQLATTAGSALGLEGEGLSQDEADQEVAKRVIRTAKDAARVLARDPNAAADPRSAVAGALTHAIGRNLPGLARQGNGAGSAMSVGAQKSGRWIRRGRRIVLLGV